MIKPFIDDPCPGYGGQDRLDDINMFVDIEKPVQVYRNLHKNCFSVRQSGTVMFHTNYLAMENCDFVVNPGGRARVLKTGQKTVHAYIRGTIVDPKKTWKGQLPFAWDSVTYNPNRFDSFVVLNSENLPVKCAKYVDMYMDTILDESECSILAVFAA
jgi:hypothetical protein